MARAQVVSRKRTPRQQILKKRGGCIPQTSSACERAPCVPRTVFVKSYKVASGKYANTNRGQYCRRPRS
jgi:hypothetical protein